MGARTKSLIRNALVQNASRAFGAAPLYVPVMVERPTGDLVPALFTQEQIAVAVLRATENPEDAPRPSWLRETWDRVRFGV